MYEPRGLPPTQINERLSRIINSGVDPDLAILASAEKNKNRQDGIFFSPGHYRKLPVKLRLMAQMDKDEGFISFSRIQSFLDYKGDSRVPRTLIGNEREVSVFVRNLEKELNDAFGAFQSSLIVSLKIMVANGWSSKRKPSFIAQAQISEPLNFDLETVKKQNEKFQKNFNQLLRLIAILQSIMDMFSETKFSTVTGVVDLRNAYTRYKNQLDEVRPISQIMQDLASQNSKKLKEAVTPVVRSKPILNMDEFSRRMMLGLKKNKAV